MSAADPMLKLGIDVIIPAGGYPMLFSREQSFAVGGATVLNGLPVAVAAAETAIRLSPADGTGTSRRRRMPAAQRSSGGVLQSPQGWPAAARIRTLPR